MYKRRFFQTITSRLKEPRRFIQVLTGPRQVGKTTLARQVLAQFEGDYHYASADTAVLEDRHWLQQRWGLTLLIV